MIIKKGGENMENVKTHICTENGTIEKLSNFDTIMKDPKDSNIIIGFRDFGGDVEVLTLFRGSEEDVDDMMLNIKSALCV